MKIIKDFTCSVTDKRWKAGEEYIGERAQELADKGLLDPNALVDAFELEETPEKAPQAPQEKISISPIKKKKIGK